MGKFLVLITALLLSGCFWDMGGTKKNVIVIEQDVAAHREGALIINPTEKYVVVWDVKEAEKYYIPVREDLKLNYDQINENNIVLLLSLAKNNPVGLPLVISCNQTNQKLIKDIISNYGAKGTNLGNPDYLVRDINTIEYYYQTKK